MSVQAGGKDDKQELAPKREYNTAQGGQSNSYSGGGSSMGDRPRLGAMEVAVDHGSNVEKALRVLKRKLIKEGLFRELKQRKYYEKPSERKKRKHKESLKKQRKEEARSKKNPFLFS